MALEIGQCLPNLKITVGNNSKPQIDEEESGEILNAEKEEALQNVQVVRKMISPLETFRKYENKDGAFITGLDLSSEVVTKKLANRAARFGLEGHPQNPITQVQIDALYESLNIDPEEGKCRNIRLDALHMRGVENMSTSDVIDYFKEYGPSSVEWINDFCCNVVWLDKAGSARALLGLSKVLVLKKKSAAEDGNQMKQDTTKDNEMDCKIDTEEVIFMSDLSSDDDDEEEEDDKLVAFKHEKSVNPVKLDAETPMDVTEPGELPDSGDEKDEKDLSVDIPVPPGHWRLGLPNAKAKAILLRFATKDDRKLPGAERRSSYYQKYGNPNYGGLKGLISNTRKRKFNITKQRQVVEQLSTKGNLNNMKLPNAEHSRKRLRMRMYADDEEEKVRLKSAKKRRTVESLSERRNVHDRLGDFVSSRRKSYEEGKWSDKDFDDEDDNQPLIVKSSISKPLSNKDKRNMIWTRLAESMAQESKIFESNDRYSSTANRRQAGDLRSKIHSSSSHPKRTDSDDKSHGDLRSKLNRLRKSEKHKKHRSPMLIDADNQSDSDR